MEFKKCKLGSIANITMGQSPKGTSYNNDGIGKPFLQGNKTFGRLYPTIDTWTTEPKKMAKKGEILMSVRAPVGDLNIANKEICIGRGLCSIEMTNGNNMYLLYLLKNSLKEIKRKSSGTVFDSINRIELEEIDVVDFDEKIQNKIIKILSKFDEKIELNNQINDNLYYLIDSLYKNDILNKFEKNHKLCELYTFQYGKGNNNPNNNGIYPVYGSNGIIGGYDKFNNEEAPVIGHIGANCGSLVFAFGKHFVTYNGVMCNIKNQEFRYFGYVTMRFLNFRNEIRGSSQPFVSYDLLDNMDIPLPGNEVILKYEKIFNPLFHNIKNNLVENKHLEHLRDTLLPKLMNGEIDLDKIEI